MEHWYIHSLCIVYSTSSEKCPFNPERLSDMFPLWRVWDNPCHWEMLRSSVDALEQMGKMYHRNSMLQIWFWFFCAGESITCCTRAPKWTENQFVRPLTTDEAALWEHTDPISDVKTHLSESKCVYVQLTSVFFFFLSVFMATCLILLSVCLWVHSVCLERASKNTFNMSVFFFSVSGIFVAPEVTLPWWISANTDSTWGPLSGVQACRHLCSIKMLIISSAISRAILL